MTDGESLVAWRASYEELEAALAQQSVLLCQKIAENSRLKAKIKKQASIIKALPDDRQMTLFHDTQGGQYEGRPARDGIEAQHGLNDVFPGDK